MELQVNHERDGGRRVAQVEGDLRSLACGVRLSGGFEGDGGKIGEGSEIVLGGTLPVEVGGEGKAVSGEEIKPDEVDGKDTGRWRELRDGEGRGGRDRSDGKCQVGFG